MTSDTSVAAILANLEAQIAVHRQQKELHAAELETLTQSLATLRAAAAVAQELADRPGIAIQPLAAPDPDPGRKPRLSRMVTLVVESWPAGQPFGISGITAEIHRRYKDRLRKPPDPRMGSVHMRRLLAAGRLAAVRGSRPHHEALYTRQAQP
ncbi:MAG: hypothetical protein JF614_04685 [Acidobacteria bacterium]|nr:hypothetical protein [Acidobacteriota bacterium]